MIQSSILKKGLFLLICISLLSAKAQQDPQFTNYIHNLTSVNPGYAGQRDVLSATAMYRNQWLGLTGAPKTLNFGIHSPLRNKKIGIGFNITSDKLGPANDTFVDGNFSYSIMLGYNKNIDLSFGVKAGVQMLNTDFSLGSAEINENVFNQGINLTSPVFGSGFYMHSDDWFLGFSMPNLFTTKHYNGIQNSIASERLHYYLVGGYIYSIDSDVYIKPSFLVKGTTGAPVIADLSVSTFFENRFTLGLAYRWGDAISGIVGFQIEKNFYLGYGYDASTSRIADFNSGSHEIFLRYELNSSTNRSSCKCF